MLKNKNIENELAQLQDAYTEILVDIHNATTEDEKTRLMRIAERLLRNIQALHKSLGYTPEWLWTMHGGHK